MPAEKFNDGDSMSDADLPPGSQEHLRDSSPQPPDRSIRVRGDVVFPREKSKRLRIKDEKAQEEELARETQRQKLIQEQGARLTAYTQRTFQDARVAGTGLLSQVNGHFLGPTNQMHHSSAMPNF